MPDVVVRWLADGQPIEGGLETLDDAHGAAGWCWVDVTAPDQATMDEVARHFDIHPLAIEDVLHVQHRPKLDLFATEIFISWLTPRCGPEGCVDPLELDIIIGETFLLTAHAEPIDFGKMFRNGDREGLERGADWTLHRIIDQLVDQALPLVDRVGEELDELEDAMVERLDPSQLGRLHRLRRELVELHRIVSPERDIVRALARERDVVSQEAYRYFLDVGDHLARVDDAIETYRDVAASVMDIYLSVQNNRMNDIMKQLTVVATIFMPLTLISGIYGMNVVLGMWPPIRAVWSFWAVVGSMVGIAAWMMWYFRRKKWW